MILSYQSGFIFIKTIKTASTSVEIFLSRYCGSKDVITFLPDADEAIRRELGYPGPQNCFHPLYRQFFYRLLGQKKMRYLYRIRHNISASDLKKEISASSWQDLLKMTIVRNPYDRAISKFYNDHKDQYLDYQYQGKSYSLGYVNEYIAGLRDADLTNWHLYSEGDTIIVDEVMRFETLQTELARVLEKLGINDPVALPRAKGNWRTDRRHYSTVLGDEARRRIETAAAREIETFGYRWEDRVS